MNTRAVGIGSWSLFALLASGCATTPAPGEKIVLTVTEIPHERHQLEHNPALSLALKRGVTRADVTSKRLINAGCYELRPDGSTYYRQVLSLMPIGVTVKSGDIFQSSAEMARIDKWSSLSFGRYVGSSQASDADFFPYKYAISNKAYRCDETLPKDVVAVQAYFAVEAHLFDDALAEAKRNNQITDEELALGRIIIGDCAIGLESWAVWKARLPPELEVHVGDYLEAIAGSHEGPGSTGPLSTAIQKVMTPPIDDFVASVGRGDFTLSPRGYPVQYKVSCGAHAIPFAKEQY